MPPTSTTGTGPKRMLTLGAKVRSRYNCQNKKTKQNKKHAEFDKYVITTIASTEAA